MESKEILVIDLGQGNQTSEINLLGQTICVHKVGCGGDPSQAEDLIRRYDGQVAAIALEGMPSLLQLGNSSRVHKIGSALRAAAQQTPVVDGSGIRYGLERWGIILADRMQPGIFSHKHILLTPGLNHTGMASALARHTPYLRYADPVIYFGLPEFPGVGNRKTLTQAAPLTLEQLKDAPFRRITPQAGRPGKARASMPFQWADVIAGDIGAIRRYAPRELRHKTVLVNSASEADLQDLAKRGVSIVITLLRPLDGNSPLRGVSEAVVEAVFVALRPNPESALDENTYLDLISEIEWKPDIRYLQAAEAEVNRFAFVIHPLNVKFIHKHRLFGWTRHLPDTLVEWVSAYMPPIYISKITGGKSPLTGQKIEGYLYSLGATPRQMMRHDEHFTYLRLNQAARMAERRGARIMGLGAFTSVVGDAGITVAREADIAITSGNSLTVAATLEAAKQAVIQMGATDLTRGRVMIIGATGSIGSVCSRLLAQAIHDVVLVSIEPERLIDLKRTIQRETPGAQVTIATRSDELAGSCDLIVTATSAFGQRVLDITQCKPGAVICDVARPMDISPAEAALRPDVLVIESGEVLIPGEIDFGYDIGLPPKTSYACLAETALLAMEGRFEDYTLGRNLEIERVKEIYRLFKKHNFQLAGLRSFDRYIREEDFHAKRLLAEKLRSDPKLFAQLKAETTARLAAIPAAAKGVSKQAGFDRRWLWVLGALTGLGWLVYRIAGINVKRKDAC